MTPKNSVCVVASATDPPDKTTNCTMILSTYNRPVELSIVLTRVTWLVDVDADNGCTVLTRVTWLVDVDPDSGWIELMIVVWVTRSPVAIMSPA